MNSRSVSQEMLTDKEKVKEIMIGHAHRYKPYAIYD